MPTGNTPIPSVMPTTPLWSPISDEEVFSGRVHTETPTPKYSGFCILKPQSSKTSLACLRPDRGFQGQWYPGKKQLRLNLAPGHGAVVLWKLTQKGKASQILRYRAQLRGQ